MALQSVTADADDDGVKRRDLEEMRRKSARLLCASFGRL